jgi:hypothetical protein
MTLPQSRDASTARRGRAPFDGSKVWAQVLHSNAIPAGSDPSCPNAGSIACLLLESVGSQQGPKGREYLKENHLHPTIKHERGSAPEDGCSTSADVRNQTLVPTTSTSVKASKLRNPCRRNVRALYTRRLAHTSPQLALFSAQRDGKTRRPEKDFYWTTGAL